METEGGSKPKQTICSDRLLLVEGKDEVNLFDALLTHCLGSGWKQEMQVIEAGGKDGFSRTIRTIEIVTRGRPTFQAIGAIRDADDNAASAFQSVCGALRHAGYEPPRIHGEVSSGNPAVGVFILPGGAAGGAIETLCRRSVAANDTGRCVEAYIECLKDHGALRSRNEDKTFAHAYLAAGEDPVARVGEGAQQGAWDFDSGAFADLSDFLRRLFAPAL